MSSAAKTKRQIKKQNINKVISNCAGSVNIVPHKDISNPAYRTEEEYQKSFTEMEAFSKRITDTQKQNINVIVYNDSNTDGMVSGYIAYRYLYIDHKKTNIALVPVREEHGTRAHSMTVRYLDTLKNGNVLVVDLDLSQLTIDTLKKHVKSLLIIDDHVDATKPNNSKKNSSVPIFKSKDHSAVAVTWKFFYPTEPVPKFVQAIDISDRKRFVPYLSNTDLFATAIGFRFSHNPLITKKTKTDLQSTGLMSQLHDIVEENNVNFWVFLGKMFDEIQENFKFQVAKNYVVKQFQGYKVGVLNVGVPAIKKRVARQIISNSQLRGERIDFAVVYGFEYTAGEAWQVTLLEEHTGQPPKYNLPALARKLGNFGHGGGGARYVGNFYYKGDIFSLFK